MKLIGHPVRTGLTWPVRTGSIGQKCPPGQVRYFSLMPWSMLMILCIFVIYPRVLIPNTICILLQLVFPHVVEPYDHLLLGLCFNLPYLTACAIFYLLE